MACSRAGWTRHFPSPSSDHLVLLARAAPLMSTSSRLSSATESAIESAGPPLMSASSSAWSAVRGVPVHRLHPLPGHVQVHGQALAPGQCPAHRPPAVRTRSCVGRPQVVGHNSRWQPLCRSARVRKAFTATQTQLPQPKN